MRRRLQRARLAAEHGAPRAGAARRARRDDVFVERGRVIKATRRRQDSAADTKRVAFDGHRDGPVVFDENVRKDVFVENAGERLAEQTGALAAVRRAAQAPGKNRLARRAQSLRDDTKIRFFVSSS